MLIFSLSNIASLLCYLMFQCVTWLPKTYMLIFAISDIVFALRYLKSPSLPGNPNKHSASPLRYLKSPCVTWLPKTYMHEADIHSVWNSFTAPLPTIPLRYLVTQNIDANIVIVWHWLSPPLPKVPLRYLVTQNIYADICLYWHSLYASLPKVPIALPGYPKHVCWYSHCLT